MSITKENRRMGALTDAKYFSSVNNINYRIKSDAFIEQYSN